MKKLDKKCRSVIHIRQLYLNNKENGITLIALVITIIVLLILAGVSIAMLTGQNGILSRTSEAGIKNEIAAVEEKANLVYTNINSDNIANNLNKTDREMMNFVVNTLNKEGYKTILDTYERKITGISVSEENISLSPLNEDGEKTKDIKVKLLTEENNMDTNYLITINNRIYKMFFENGKIKISDNPVQTEDKNKGYTLTLTPTNIVTNGMVLLAVNGENMVAEKTINLMDDLTIKVSSTITQINDFNDLLSIDIKDKLGNCIGEPKILKIAVEKEYDFTLTLNNYAQTGITREGDVVIPETFRYGGKKYKIVGIDELTFKDCTKLTSVKIPKSVVSIEGNVNSDCGTFANCTALKSVTFEEGLESIGSQAFYNCISLKNIELPNSLKFLSGFGNCLSLTSITIPKSVEQIGGSAFRNCTFLTSITIPNSVKEIGAEAFYGCKALASLKLSNSINKICREFIFSTSIECLEIPKSVKKIEGRGLDTYGSKLTRIMYDGTVKEWNSIEKEEKWFWSWGGYGYSQPHITIVCSDGEITT